MEIRFWTKRERPGVVLSGCGGVSVEGRAGEEEKDAGEDGHQTGRRTIQPLEREGEGEIGDQEQAHPEGTRPLGALGTMYVEVMAYGVSHHAGQPSNGRTKPSSSLKAAMEGGFGSPRRKDPPGRYYPISQ